MQEAVSESAPAGAAGESSPVGEPSVGELAGKTVVITGASSGIGATTAALLGARGARVIAHYASNRDGAEQAVAAVPDDRKLVIGCDFERDDVDRLWSSAVEWAGRIDVLVSNAAVMPEAGLDESDEAWASSWERAMHVNVVQAANLMRRAVDHFVTASTGTLVTVSSWAGQRGSGNPRLTAYAASKAAIMAATKTLARTYASDGIVAYCIAPGPVDTEMTHRSMQSQGGHDAVVNSLAMRELVPPSEIAELIAFLCRGAARHSSGATFDVNGATYVR